MAGYGSIFSSLEQSPTDIRQSLDNKKKRNTVDSTPNELSQAGNPIEQKNNNVVDFKAAAQALSQQNAVQAQQADIQNSERSYQLNAQPGFGSSKKPTPEQLKSYAPIRGMGMPVPGQPSNFTPRMR